MKTDFKRPDPKYASEAHVVYGYKLKEIALVLGLHYTTVSAMVSAAEGKYEN